MEIQNKNHLVMYTFIKKTNFLNTLTLCNITFVLNNVGATMAPHLSHGELTFSISITARMLIKLYRLLHYFIVAIWKT